jgi:hypothetical protein
VSASGTLGVGYYDVRRDSVHDTAFSTDYWATTTADGLHFAGDRHLAGPFDLAAAPVAGGYFVGDYEGLTAAGRDFAAVFAMTNCRGEGCVENRTDIYSTRFPAQLGSVAAGSGRGTVAVQREILRRPYLTR